MMKTVPGASLDASGYLEFEGNPYELQEGDLVQDGQYAVLEIKPDNHNGEKATLIQLADASEYVFETPRGGLPKSYGRSTLVNNTWLRFKRQVDGSIFFGVEEELYQELVECDHDEHDDYDYEWRGKCRDIPKGMLVGINLGDGRPSCQIVDSVYETGVVLFKSGAAYQSHPDKEWIGWFELPVSQGG
jgi:hypothetical protein